MPSIYVGTYGKYNSGSIAGAWLDMDKFSDAEDFYNACHKLHKGEHDPEFMFQDYEGFPEGMISESHLSDKFWEWNALEDHQKDMIEAFHSVASEPDADIQRIEDCYCGEHDSFADYVYESFTSCNDIPDHLVNFIDWESVEREWSFDHMIAEITKFDGLKGYSITRTFIFSNY